MKKSTLIIISVCMLIVAVVGIYISVSGQEGPKGTYVCDDEFFGYEIKFDGDKAYVGSSARGTVTVNGADVYIKYTDGTTDHFIYKEEYDCLTDTGGVLKWYKK